MPKETSTTIRPKDFMHGLVSTPEFMGALAHTPDIDTESGIGRTPLAMGAAAAMLVEKFRRDKKSDYLDDKHRWMNLVAQTPGAVEGFAILDAPGGLYDRHEIKKAKLAAIKFNHALREIIDYSPEITRGQLQSLVAEMTMGIVPNDQAKSFGYHVRGRITGMQQEIFTEQALWSIDGVDVGESVSVEDDKRGVDIRFTYEGREYALDVKSTAEKASEALANRQPHDEAIPFWTGLRGFELGEHFRADEDQVAVIRSRLLALLNEEASARQAVS